MAPDIPAPYRRVPAGRATLVAAPGAAEWAREAVRRAGTLFDFAAGHADAEPLAGRGRLYHIPAPNGDGRLVVRHYRRGGAVAHVLDDRYARLGTPRPIRELRASCAVRARGIDTPEVTALAIYPAGIFYRADLVTRYVPDSIDLARTLFVPEARDADDRMAACRAAGRLIRCLHERGVVHPDLNLKNILLAWSTRPPRPYLLDLDRCRTVERVSDRRRERMLARFRRSLDKWECKSGRTVPEAEREAFNDGYRRGDG